MSWNAAFTEDLIKEIEKHPVLYDISHSKYKHFKFKEKVWNEIASKLNYRGITGAVLMKKWKNLKDNYAKHLRTESPRTEEDFKIISRYKAWPWAKHMEPFRKFIGYTKRDIYTSDKTQPQSLGASKTSSRDVSNHEAKINEIDYLIAEPAKVQRKNRNNSSSAIRVSTRDKKKCSQNISQSSSGKTQMHFPEKTHYAQEEKDDIYKIFEGYAATARKLTPRSQTLIKYNIAKMLMNAELEQQQEVDDEVRNRQHRSVFIDNSYSFLNTSVDLIDTLKKSPREDFSDYLSS